MAEVREIGRIKSLWRYPVKSMAGEAVDRAEVSWHGIEGDRRWAFVRDGVQASGFPWLTIRQRPGMIGYRPVLVDPSAPNTSATVVHTPDGNVYDVMDPDLSAELWPEGARVIRQNRGVFDTFPLSLITTGTVAGIGEAVGRPLDVARFRPNLLIETVAKDPFLEDAWVGAVLRIGSARLRVDKRDGRCAVVNVDPSTAERDSDILRAIANERGGCLGVYGSTVQPGEITVDDRVFLE